MQHALELTSQAVAKRQYYDRRWIATAVKIGDLVLGEKHTLSEVSGAFRKN